MKYPITIAAVLLAGCAASPQQMAQQSNFEVCRFTMGGPHSSVAQAEANRRGLDCREYYPAIQGQLQRENAAVGNALQMLNRPPPPAPVMPQSCRTVYKGNGIYDTVCQ